MAATAYPKIKIPIACNTPILTHGFPPHFGHRRASLATALLQCWHEIIMLFVGHNDMAEHFDSRTTIEAAIVVAVDAVRHRKTDANQKHVAHCAVS